MSYQVIRKFAPSCFGDNARKHRFILEKNFRGFKEGCHQGVGLCPTVTIALAQCPNQFSQHDKAHEGRIVRRSTSEKACSRFELHLVIAKNEPKQNIGVDGYHVPLP